MKEIHVTKYQCSVCGMVYETKSDAVLCESRPVTQDKGVKIGDLVTVTSGEGAGSQAKVTQVFVYDMNWGHYYHDRYWHTIGLNANLVNDFGSRQLTFDSYETVK